MASHRSDLARPFAAFAARLVVIVVDGLAVHGASTAGVPITAYERPAMPVWRARAETPALLRRLEQHVLVAEKVPVLSADVRRRPR